MADTHSALEQLADISEPMLPADFAFTPAMGIALLGLLLGIVFLLYKMYRRWRYFAAKRQALVLLEQLSVAKDAPGKINMLLKRVLQHYQGNHQALSYNSKDWQHWLAQQHPLPLPDLTHLLYSNANDTAAREQLYQFARAWLRAYQGKAAVNCWPEAKHA